MRAALLILGLLLTCSAWANIGSVTELSGVATIKRGKDIIPVVKATTVEMNDRVETKGGKLKITFQDGTIVNVTENSALVIDDFVYDPKSNAGKLGLKAAAGTVRYVSGAIAHNNPNAVNVRTPTAVIAVRGTDFIMSVNEVGSSMVILMPSCESNSISGTSCTSGRIEVESGPNRISMDRPYQATLVESTGQPPTPPIIVNLANTPIGNNLQIAPPKTLGGASVVAAARAAAVATGAAKEAKKEDKKEEVDSTEETTAASTQDKKEGSKNAETTVVVKSDETPQEVVAVADPENPYLFKLWKDKSQTQQIGWQYESLSPSNKNYAAIVLPVDTKVQVIVTQDMQTNAYSFVTKPSGQIVINQSSK